MIFLKIVMNKNSRDIINSIFFSNFTLEADMFIQIDS